MDSTALLYYNASINIVPLYFCIFASRRIYRHRLDGLQSEILTDPRVYEAKRNLTLTLILCSLFDVLLEHINIYEEGLTLTQFERAVFCLLATLAWGSSHYLLAFDLKRRIKLSWAGQALYYLVNVPLYLTDVYSISFEYRSNLWGFMYTMRVTTNALSAGCCVILSYLTFTRPNEFSINSVDYTQLELSPTYSSSKVHPKMTNLKVSVEGYKAKVIEGTRVIFYSIIVNLDNDTHIVRRTYAECKALADSLDQAFPKQQSLRLQMPTFPDLRNKSMELLVNDLSEYFRLISSPVFLTSEFLEFLQLQCSDQIQLEQDFLRRFYSNESITDASGLEPSYAALPLHVFFQVKLTYQTVGGNVEYCLKWICIPNGALGEAYHRYSSLLKVHKELVKLIKPSKLPNFPSKQYLSRLSTHIDFKLVEKRSKQLELYYNTVLNDPAYLCSPLLLFINCEIPLSFIVPASIPPVVRLNGPITVEAQWTGEKVSCVFTMSFFKADIDGTSVNWTISQPLYAFRQLAEYLQQRSRSPLLQYYMRMLHEDDDCCDIVPRLPKTFKDNAGKLQSFIEGCLTSRHILNCLIFRQFLSHAVK